MNIEDIYVVIDPSDGGKEPITSGDYPHSLKMFKNILNIENKLSSIRAIQPQDGGPDVILSNLKVTKAMKKKLEKERAEILEQRWQDGGFNYLGSFNDFVTNAESNGVAAAFIHDKIRQRAQALAGELERGPRAG